MFQCMDSDLYTRHVINKYNNSFATQNCIHGFMLCKQGIKDIDLCPAKSIEFFNRSVSNSPLHMYSDNTEQYATNMTYNNCKQLFSRR